jgi:hypothetical protein
MFSFADELCFQQPTTAGSPLVYGSLRSHPVRIFTAVNNTNCPGSQKRCRSGEMFFLMASDSWGCIVRCLMPAEGKEWVSVQECYGLDRTRSVEAV